MLMILRNRNFLKSSRLANIHDRRWWWFIVYEELADLYSSYGEFSFIGIDKLLNNLGFKRKI